MPRTPQRTQAQNFIVSVGDAIIGQEAASGGDVLLQGGSSTAGNNDGGNVLIRGGSPDGTGEPGVVVVSNNTGTEDAPVLALSSETGNSHTFHFFTGTVNPNTDSVPALAGGDIFVQSSGALWVASSAGTGNWVESGAGAPPSWGDVLATGNESDGTSPTITGTDRLIFDVTASGILDFILGGDTTWVVGAQTSDFFVERYVGALLEDRPLEIDNATGDVTIVNDLNVGDETAGDAAINLLGGASNEGILNFSTIGGPIAQIVGDMGDLTLRFSAGGDTQRILLSSGVLRPANGQSIDLGDNATERFSNVLISGRFDVLRSASGEFGRTDRTSDVTIDYSFYDEGILRWQHRLQNDINTNGLQWRRHDASGAFQNIPLFLRGDTGDAMFSSRLFAKGAPVSGWNSGADGLCIGGGTAINQGVSVWPGDANFGQFVVRSSTEAYAGALRYEIANDRWVHIVDNTAVLALGPNYLRPISNGGLQLGGDLNRFADAFLTGALHVSDAPIGGWSGTANRIVIGNNSGNQGISMFPSNSGVAAWYVRNSTSNSRAWQLYNLASNDWQWGAEGSSRMLLSSAALTPSNNRGLQLGDTTRGFSALQLGDGSAAANPSGGQQVIYTTNGEIRRKVSSGASTRLDMGFILVSRVFFDGSSEIAVNFLNEAVDTVGVISGTDAQRSQYNFVVPYNFRLRVTCLPTDALNDDFGNIICRVYQNYSTGSEVESDTIDWNATGGARTYVFSSTFFANAAYGITFQPDTDDTSYVLVTVEIIPV